MKILSFFQRHGLSLLCATTMLLLVVLIGRAESEQVLPDATGKAVVEYITKTSPYQQWGLFPGTEAFRKGREPHGALQKVYANDIAQRAFSDKVLPRPNGSLIVKESYTEDKALREITIMYKKDGFNQEAGNYLWLLLGPDYSVQKEGKLDGCIKCHDNAKGRDYIILRP